MLDSHNNLRGVVSSWDIAVEMVQSEKAFPYTPEFIQKLRSRA